MYIPYFTQIDLLSKYCFIEVLTVEVWTSYYEPKYKELYDENFMNKYNKYG